MLPSSMFPFFYGEATLCVEIVYARTYLGARLWLVSDSWSCGLYCCCCEEGWRGLRRRHRASRTRCSPCLAVLSSDLQYRLLTTHVLKFYSQKSTPNWRFDATSVKRSPGYTTPNLLFIFVVNLIFICSGYLLRLSDLVFKIRKVKNKKINLKKGKNSTRFPHKKKSPLFIKEKLENWAPSCFLKRNAYFSGPLT